MNKYIADDIISKVRALYISDEAARALLDWLAARQKDATETPVARAAEMADIYYADAVAVFRKLEEIGCGALIVGRRGYKSRFSWRFSVTSLGSAAAGADVQLDPIEGSEEGNLVPSDDMSRGNEIEHQFQLRPDFLLIVNLPDDFAPKEAERVATWVKSLPF